MLKNVSFISKLTLTLYTTFCFLTNSKEVLHLLFRKYRRTKSLPVLFKNPHFKSLQASQMGDTSQNIIDSNSSITFTSSMSPPLPSSLSLLPLSISKPSSLSPPLPSFLSSQTLSPSSPHYNSFENSAISDEIIENNSYPNDNNNINKTYYTNYNNDTNNTNISSINRVSLSQHDHSYLKSPLKKSKKAGVM